MTMEVMKKFRKFDKWYIPHSFDYRGRLYPIPSFLTQQDTDFGKSLLLFYEGAELTDEAKQWLQFDVATKYGLDKSPLHERLQWATNNEDLIHAIATDPIGYLSEWEAADEPWQFLASCEEYNALLIDCNRSHTHLPVAVDATCSGIQILAGLARDKTAAAMVNVTPAPTVSDAYAVIAEASKPHLPPEIQAVWDRKCVKRVVMTLPYNSKPKSNRKYIREALKEKGIKVEHEVLTEIVKVVRQAMHDHLPGPMDVMSWIEKEVGAAIKRGADCLEWETPSGFVVNQRLMKRNSDRVTLQLMGRCQISLGKDTNKVDINRHKAATSPNLIHSLDSAQLILTVEKFDAPIALIHDSVLCRATDMSHLNRLLRETYRHLFAEHDFIRDFAKQIGAETDPPIVGDLDPEAVMTSTYFFC